MRRVRTGDVYAIPLPNGQFAFGRAFRDAGFGVYRKMGTSITDLPNMKDEDYQFVVSVYRDLLRDNVWKFIENRPFKSEEMEWPPQRCIKDSISGEYSIYYKGEIYPAKKEECEGLEVAAVWDRNHIIDRIMGDTKWNL